MKLGIKKLLVLALVVAMTFCFVGCGGSGDSSSDSSSAPVNNSEVVTSTDSTNDNTSSKDATSNASSKTPSSNQTSTPSKPVESDKPDVQVDYEKSSAGKGTVLYNKQTSKYDSQADTMRNKIINSKDSGLKGKTTYYVSYKGSDFNTGTSPDSAWQTIDMVNGLVPENSIVLFERGGVYRGSLKLKSNCSYGAYGSGVKPAIYGSKKNYADESLWKQSSKYGGSWYAKTDETDIGQIVFDHGKQVATPVAPGATSAKPYNFVLTGGKVYVCIEENPAKLYDSIEISGLRHVIYGEFVKNVTIENLCVKYGGKHGISFSGNAGRACENITVRNCEVGYIGGCGGTVPLGNGIEFWLDTKNVTVENCWVYQCFDAGITNQGQRKDGKPNVQEGITYKNNLIEYCIYGIEYFAGQGSAGSTIKNTIYTGNIIRFSGMGWSSPENRVGEGTDWKNSSVSAINGWATSKAGVGDFPAENFVIENNIFDTSWKFLINMVQPNTSGRVTVRNNTYYQKASDTAAAGIWLKGDNQVRVESLEQMKEIINNLDSSPNSIELVK